MEKRVLPILIIVILCVMVLCTYAWFSNGQIEPIEQKIEPGFPAQMQFTANGGVLTSPIFNVKSMTGGTYQGQLGFKEDKTPYQQGDDNYRYVVELNLQYTASSKKRAKITVQLDKVVIHLNDYSNDVAYLFNNVFGAGTVTDENKAQYIGSIENDQFKPATVDNADITKYCILDANSIPTYLILAGEYPETFFEFDYWKSNSQGIARNAAGYTSAKTTGIVLQYSENAVNTGGVCVAGNPNNYLKLFLGFYGYDSTSTETNKYRLPFEFGGNDYIGSSFSFYFTAEAMDA